MGNKRLIITSTISIVLVAILLIGSTYSIFTSTEIDEKENVYTTGVLDITYTLSEDNVIMEDATPTSIEDSIEIKPYRITVTNNGNVAYKFNVILNDTTASNKINSQYLMTQVGKLTPTLLSDCTNNILKSDIIVLPNTSVDIDIRVWLYTNVKNSEMGKSFYGKLSIDGLAVNTDETEIDNSTLIADVKQLLSTATVGSYVAYTGNNGCSGTACEGQNANYVDSSNTGYCGDSSYKFSSIGWRIAYIEDKNVHLISAGSPECMCTNNLGEISTSCSTYYDSTGTHPGNLNELSLKYCNVEYVYGESCNNDNSWNIQDEDFHKITGSILTECVKKSSVECGLNNDLIDIGGWYWYVAGNSEFVWAPETKLIWYNDPYMVRGIRPVIKLAPTVYITGGTGTQENPYTIANN